MGRRKGPALTRADVVDAAVGLVRAEGAEALGVSRVARALGIQPPSIYTHVGKGDALAWAVVLEANRELVGAYKDAVRGVDDPHAQLTLLAHTTRSWAHANVGLYALMSRVKPRNDDPAFAGLFQDLVDLFARPFGQLGVAPEDRVHAIRSLRAGIHGFVLLEAGAQFQLADDPERSFTQMVALLLGGGA